MLRNTYALIKIVTCDHTTPSSLSTLLPIACTVHVPHSNVFNSKNFVTLCSTTFNQGLSSLLASHHSLLNKTSWLHTTVSFTLSPSFKPEDSSLTTQLPLLLFNLATTKRESHLSPSLTFVLLPQASSWSYLRLIGHADFLYLATQLAFSQLECLCLEWSSQVHKSQSAIKVDNKRLKSSLIDLSTQV